MATSSATQPKTAEATVFDLGSLAPGQTVRIETDNSKYWLTRVQGGNATNEHAFGFAVMHDSAVVDQFTTSPYRVAVDREVRVGQFLNFFTARNTRREFLPAGHTGQVNKISYMR